MSNPVETPVPAKPNDWLNQQAFTVSKVTFDSFMRIKKRFQCQMCGVKLSVGFRARWIYANGTPGLATGNFFVCGDCDGPDETVLEKARESCNLAVKLSKQWDIYGPDWERDCRT